MGIISVLSLMPVNGWLFNLFDHMLHNYWVVFPNVDCLYSRNIATQSSSIWSLCVFEAANGISGSLTFSAHCDESWTYAGHPWNFTIIITPTMHVQ